MNSALTLAVGAVILGFLGVAIVGWVMPRRFCPDCGMPLPKLRLPRSIRQATGHWTCKTCGREVRWRDGKLKR
ncbi:MAG TPA: hypothetical protein VG013_06515 [Gemmataceae bacterium]|jgi:hypothetical protein|nr:hypothetical protein [Gemmataceae bacterium]